MSVTLADYFRNSRFRNSSHLGLGDIRLTMGEQEMIAKDDAALRSRLAEAEEFVYKGLHQLERCLECGEARTMRMGFRHATDCRLAAFLQAAHDQNDAARNRLGRGGVPEMSDSIWVVESRTRADPRWMIDQAYDDESVAVTVGKAEADTEREARVREYLPADAVREVVEEARRSLKQGGQFNLADMVAAIDKVLG